MNSFYLSNILKWYAQQNTSLKLLASVIVNLKGLWSLFPHGGFFINIVILISDYKGPFINTLVMGRADGRGVIKFYTLEEGVK